jgi:hypothetical protein
MDIKLRAYLRSLAENPAEKSEEDDLLLPPNKRQQQNAIDIKINWVIDIDPKEFLKLTLSDSPNSYPTIENIDPKTLDFYKSEEIQADMSVHPHLSIDEFTGKIRGHEGRHRAAAVMKAGGKWFRVGIKFVAVSRNHRPENMPKTWKAQYSNYAVNIDDLISSGKMRIVDQHIQKEYYRKARKVLLPYFLCNSILKSANILDFKKKLEEKQEKDKQEAIKKNLEQATTTQIVPPEISKDELKRKREDRFQSEVQGKIGVWMHRFSDVKKDDKGFYILKSDNPSGNKMRVGDELSDYAMNLTPYWSITKITGDRIELKPINNNPFKTGIGAGGAKLSKFDIDVYTGEQERKHIKQIMNEIEKGNVSIDTLKYILEGTVPLQFGPNGAQGGWYNVDDRNNRGGNKGMIAQDIMVYDAKKLKEFGLQVPIKALDGTMKPSAWNDWISGNGSNAPYIPKDLDKYIDFSRKMTEKGRWKHDEKSLKELRRQYDEKEVEKYYEQMLADVSKLTPEEWKEQYGYHDQNAGYVVRAYERALAGIKGQKEQFSMHRTEGEDEDPEIENIMKNVFSNERRISIRNIEILINKCKENQEYVKYLHDIINLGGAKDYIANEKIIDFFDLIDDVEGLKAAALKINETDNLRYAFGYLFDRGEEEFVLNENKKHLDNPHILSGVLYRLYRQYDENKELRDKTFGRNEKLLNYVKDNDIVNRLANVVADEKNLLRYHSGDALSYILRSFGPNDMWQPGDKELVDRLTLLYNKVK